MLNKVRNMFSGIVTSLLHQWPHNDLVQSRDLIDVELKRRYVEANANDPDPCEGCHNCCADDDTDEDDAEPVPGTVKQNFYDVWVEFNDLTSTKYQQLKALEKIIDTLALTPSTERDLFKQFERDSTEKLSARIVKLPILSQDQLNTLLKAEYEINEKGWDPRIGANSLSGAKVFTLTYSLIVE